MGGHRPGRWMTNGEAGTRPRRSTAACSCWLRWRRADGTGAPGEQLWEPPNNRTAYWFGFVCSPQPFTTPGTGEITGTARNWVEWAPYTTGTYNTPVDNPFVALSDSTTDRTVYVGRGDANGNFDIRNVPAGSYNLSVWDEQLSYIMRFKPVTVQAGQTVDVNETGDDGEVGLGVSRWFGWIRTTTSTATGTFTLKVFGVNGSLTRQASATLVVK